MARPRKENHEKRCERLSTDVTTAQKAEVVQRARAAGLSLADYNRKAILGRRISSNAATGNSAILCELSRIFVSLEEAKDSLMKTMVGWKNLKEGQKETLRKIFVADNENSPFVEGRRTVIALERPNQRPCRKVR